MLDDQTAVRHHFKTRLFGVSRLWINTKLQPKHFHRPLLDLVDDIRDYRKHGKHRRTFYTPQASLSFGYMRKPFVEVWDRYLPRPNRACACKYDIMARFVGVVAQAVNGEPFIFRQKVFNLAVFHVHENLRWCLFVECSPRIDANLSLNWQKCKAKLQRFQRCFH